MFLYKYRSLDDLWILLDIVINNQVWCANWGALNDPFEGRFDAHFDDDFINNVTEKRDKWRICALSKNLDNCLLWSHYASGHKGIAIEIEIPEDHSNLEKINYSPFTPLFTEREQSQLDQKHLFTIKSLEWKYEKEYRILFQESFFKLPNSIRKIYLGALISDKHKKLLKIILPTEIEIVEMKLNLIQNKVEPKNIIDKHIT